MDAIKQFSGLWIGLLFFFSCAADKGPALKKDLDYQITGIQWELTQLYGEPVNMPVSFDRPFVQFSSEENRLQGHTGCNGFFGTYEKSKESISFGPIGMTQMACEPVMDLEAGFVKALEQTKTFRIKEDKLFFFSLGDPVAIFTRQDNGD